MAHTLTPKDVHVLIDAMAAQMQGQGSISAINTSDFVSAGESMLAAGLENTLNAFSMVIGRTFAAVRPYSQRVYSGRDQYGSLYGQIPEDQLL